MNKVFVRHWTGQDLDVEGLYCSIRGKTKDIRVEPSQWVDVADEDFGDWLKGLSIQYDVMLKGPSKPFPHWLVWLNGRGKGFNLQ